MKLNFLKTFAVTAGLILGLGLTACNNDDPDSDKLWLSEETLSFTSNAETKSITVTSKQDWNIQNENSWITATRDGNQLVVKVPENDTEQVRLGDIIITNNQESKKLQVIQIADPVPLEELNFRWKNAEPQLLPVDVEGEWDYDITEPGWMKVERSGNILTVTVEDNFTNKERSSSIVITSPKESKSIDVKQRDKSIISYKQMSTDNIGVMFISANGRYLTGHASPIGAIFWDRETDEYISFGADVLASGVTNDGVVVGHNSAHKPAYYKGGAWHEAKLSNVPGAQGKEGTIWATNADGTVMGGSLTWHNGVYHNPIVWRNGPENDAEFLENPSVDVIGESPAQAGRIFNISHDGKTFSGRHTTRFGLHDVFCVWAPDFSWPGETEVIETGGKTHISSYHFTRSGAMSPSGEWCTGYKSGGLPFKYNTKTKEMIYSHEVRYTNPGYITDDGTQFHYIMTDTSASSYVWVDNRIYEFDDWLEMEHNVRLGIDNLMICQLSADGKVFGGSIMLGGATAAGNIPCASIWIEIED